MLALRDLVHLLIAAAVTGMVSEAAAQEVKAFCWTTRPAIYEGEDVDLHVVGATDAPPSRDVRYIWKVDAGEIKVQAANTRWSLDNVKVPQTDLTRVVTATAIAKHPQGLAECRVTVVVNRHVPNTPRFDRGPVSTETAQTAVVAAVAPIISTHSLLVRGVAAGGTYGLYSYLLFSAAPRNDADRTRQLSAIQAVLSVLPDLQVLGKSVLTRQLNVTYIPVVASPNIEGTIDRLATQILQHYDYHTAKLLLAATRQTLQNGPYLLSSRSRLEYSSQVRPEVEIDDLEGVAPSVIWDRVRLFEYLAAAERGWGETTLKRFATDFRNIVAIVGLVVPQAAQVPRRVASPP